MINPEIASKSRQQKILRTEASASLSAFGALLMRDLTVLRKNLSEFIPRTIIQPFLLVFVFLYVFPQIGEGIGSGSGPAGESRFAAVLISGVVGLSMMFQGIQAVALPLSTEFGYTKEIEDRVLAPLPVSLVAIEKVIAGTIQGFIAASLVFPIAYIIHAKSIQIQLSVHWPVLLTLIPITGIMTSSFGLVLGTRIAPRNVGAMFGFIVLPITFLGGTYYPWTSLSALKIFGFPWLQALVCLNPLIYVTEGFRAALTDVPHMNLYIIYPVLTAFCLIFLWVGIKGFKKRVLS